VVTQEGYPTRAGFGNPEPAPVVAMIPMVFIGGFITFEISNH
jgi:hypothetical protein